MYYPLFLYYILKISKKFGEIWKKKNLFCKYLKYCGKYFVRNALEDHRNILKVFNYTSIFTAVDVHTCQSKTLFFYAVNLNLYRHQETF